MTRKTLIAALVTVVALGGYWSLADEKSPAASSEFLTCTVAKTENGEVLQVAFRDMTLKLPYVQVERNGKKHSLRAENGAVVLEHDRVVMSAKKISLDLSGKTIKIEGSSSLDLQLP